MMYAIVRDEGVGGSNPLTPTSLFPDKIKPCFCTENSAPKGSPNDWLATDLPWLLLLALFGAVMWGGL